MGKLLLLAGILVLWDCVRLAVIKGLTLLLYLDCPPPDPATHPKGADLLEPLKIRTSKRNIGMVLTPTWTFFFFWTFPCISLLPVHKQKHYHACQLAPVCLQAAWPSQFLQSVDVHSIALLSA